mgnify:CR=1 FL=1
MRLYNQMGEPKYVIAMGACAISGRPVQAGLQCAQGIDRYIPVDVHIPGCPPRPEALLHAFMTLQEKIGEQQLTGAQRPPHLNADAPSEFPVPRFGEHDLEPAKNPESGSRAETRSCLMETLEQVKSRIEAVVPGANVRRLVANDSPCGQRSLLVSSQHGLGGCEVSVQ